MAQKPSQDTSATRFDTTPPSALTTPDWAASALLVLRALRAAPVWGALAERVRVPRGRAGVFVALDFLLVLVTFAASDALDLKALFARLGPVARACAATWDRLRLPSRAALSRFLAAVHPDHVAALGDVLLEDLIDSGLPAERAGGVIDRAGRRTLVFDDDGTYHGARQRSLAGGATRPPARRRAAALCARGHHGGSRRADVTRTRTALQQAHTQEWLGCWSAPGSGRPFAQLDAACAAVVRYLAARGLGATQGLLRLDGLYGWARVAAAVARHGLGYLMRCADYRLLDRRAVRAVLATPPHTTFATPDSPVRREVWQVLDFPWAAAKDPTQRVSTRLLITRRPAAGPGAPAVGKRRPDGVYELFVTDRDAAGWSPEDVLSVYFARGGFEATLAQEDRERDLDRTVSWSPAGQSLWTLLGQLVWNVRVRLGVALAAAPVRVTLWALAPTPALAPPAPAPPTPAPPSPCAPGPAVDAAGPERGRIAAAWGRSTGRFGGDDFVWTEAGHLRCPKGALLRRWKARREGDQLRVTYRAEPADCRACALSARCRGRPTRADRARSVSVVEPWPSATPAAPEAVDGPRPADATMAAARPPAAPVAPPSPRAVWWVDVASCAARRRLREQLWGQRVDVEPAPFGDVPAAPPPTRDDRAHRRRTWAQRAQRNQRLAHDGVRIRVHGVPAPLDAMLGTLRAFPHAA